MSKFHRNRIKDGWEKLHKQTDTTKIMVTWPWTNYCHDGTGIYIVVSFGPFLLRKKIAVMVLVSFFHECLSTPSRGARYGQLRQWWGCDLDRPLHAQKTVSGSDNTWRDQGCREHVWQNMIYTTVPTDHREAEKKEPFSFVCIFSNTQQKVANFFTYTKESISYNSVCLILACVQKFA